VRVNTNLWTCAEARKYFKSKGFESSDPIRNQYGELPLFISSQRVTPAGKGSRRMNTYRTFWFSTLELGSTRRRLINLERSSSRTRRPAFQRPCWHKIFMNLMETSSMRQRPQETRRLTSVPCSGTKERSAPSSTHSSYVFLPRTGLLDCCGD
jgi:hypothetical protein